MWVRTRSSNSERMTTVAGKRYCHFVPVSGESEQCQPFSQWGVAGKLAHRTRNPALAIVDHSKKGVILRKRLVAAGLHGAARTPEDFERLGGEVVLGERLRHHVLDSELRKPVKGLKTNNSLIVPYAPWRHASRDKPSRIKLKSLRSGSSCNRHRSPKRTLDNRLMS